MGAAAQAHLVGLVGALEASGARNPHVYTLNSGAVLGDLQAAGYRALKHRVL